MSFPFSTRHILTVFAVLFALVMAVAPPAIFGPEQARILGVVLVTLVLWGTGVVPGYLASLIFFAVLLVLDLAPPDLVFAGFQSTAVWLIVSGFVIGAAISVSGPIKRVHENQARIVDELKSVGAMISKRLGYVGAMKQKR